MVPLVFWSKVRLTLGFLAGGCLEAALRVFTFTSAESAAASLVSALSGLSRANTKLLPLAPLPTLSSFPLWNCAILSSDLSPRAMKEPRMFLP